MADATPHCDLHVELLGTQKLKISFMAKIFEKAEASALPDAVRQQQHLQGVHPFTAAPSHLWFPADRRNLEKAIPIPFKGGDRPADDAPDCDIRDREHSRGLAGWSCFRSDRSYGTAGGDNS